MMQGRVGSKGGVGRWEICLETNGDRDWIVGWCGWRLWVRGCIKVYIPGTFFPLESRDENLRIDDVLGMEGNSNS